MGLGFLLQMVENLLESLPRERSECFGYHYRIFDAGNDVQGRTNAAGAGIARAAIFMVPPQTLQVSMSMLKTRLSRCAQSLPRT